MILQTRAKAGLLTYKGVLDIGHLKPGQIIGRGTLELNGANRRAMEPLEPRRTGAAEFNHPIQRDLVPADVISHRSSKKPAAAILPGAREETGALMSTTA